MDTIRIAEFAWSIFEPEEGQFDFTLFDRAMDLAHEHGLRVILGTPTATPPAWLTTKYPEVLSVTKAGVQLQHGERRHYNFSTAIYRQLSERIADRMAAHYADHPALVGWQIDNELACGSGVANAPADHAAFRIWLQARYGTLANLNDTWGTVFWNQTYSDWDQVHLTRATPANSPNPHQALDEKRFDSDSLRSYVRLQVDAIRAHDRTHWITTNGLFGYLDSHGLTTDLLDFFSYDSYPQFGVVWPDQGEPPLLDRKVSADLSVIRGISPQFCIMEQQSGPGGWVNWLEQPTPKPGQIRLWTYQSIAHGADMLLYFRWRTATFGTEIYWHGINDYHNRPNRRCEEVTQIGKELASIGDRVIGSEYQADVAILRDYDNDWDGDLDTWHGPYAKQSIAAWFAALQRRHVPVDIPYLNAATTAADLARYRVLIYPHPAILTDRTADILKEYVQNGGRIVFACRTGYKDDRGHCVMRPMPGPVADLCGVDIEDFTRIAAIQTAPSLHWETDGTSGRLSTGPFNDILRPTGPDTEILATYGEDAGYYAGKPALVRNPWGAGHAYYYGGVFTPAVASALADHLGLTSPLAGRLTLSPDIELAIRRRPNGDPLIFLLNYADTPQPVTLHQEMTDLLTGAPTFGEQLLPPYAVRVLSMVEAERP